MPLLLYPFKNKVYCSNLKTTGQQACGGVEGVF
jgi:hypothetical protein